MKIGNVLNDWMKHFIQQSPFLVLASADAEGNCDASPRGGSCGFVRVLNDQQLLIPDYRGNALFQSYHNILANPLIGLVFLIPGFNETARVNGKATILSKQEVGDYLARHGFPLGADEPNCLQGLLVDIKEAYYHCGRAVKQSNLWDTLAIEHNKATPPLPKRPKSNNKA